MSISGSPLYNYRARLLRVVDGDTIDVMLDLGFQTYCSQRLRLLGVDTPERGQPGFVEASDVTASTLNAAAVITVHTVRKDSFGRWLAEVWADSVHLNAQLRSRGWKA